MSVYVNGYGKWKAQLKQNEWRKVGDPQSTMNVRITSLSSGGKNTVVPVIHVFILKEPVNYDLRFDCYNCWPLFVPNSFLIFLDIIC